MKYFFSVCFLILASTLLSPAQVSQGGLPVSFDPSLNKSLINKIPTVSMPVVDTERLISEDVRNASDKEIPWRFGENIPVDIDIKTDGLTDLLAKGNKLYRLRVYAAGAFSINLTFDDYRLPPGAKLFIYNEQKAQVLGAFTDFNNQADNYFATTLIEGESVIIEYSEPENVPFEGKLHLSRVTHGYRNVFDFTAKAFGSSGSCNNNVACPEATGWENQIKSVCMLVVNGNGFCTGSLLNNTANDGIPYVMTANHCSGSNNFGSWVFWFNWQSPTCTNPGSNPAHDQVTTSGCVLKARNATSDFCLVQMNQAPPQNFNVYYAGWSKEGIVTSSATGIHHPNGDIKKISFANNPTASVVYSSVDSWQALWTDGVTEPGSSGSPLFDSNHRFIGQLYGGPSSCSATPGNMTDYYGKLSVSWDGASSSSRAKDWLDPLGTDPPFIDGFDPEVPEFYLDAMPQTVVSPSSSYCSEQNIIPSVVIKNNGIWPLTNLVVKYNIDNGPYVLHSWSGNLTTYDTTVITFPSLAVTSGDHVFCLVTSLPNGANDENPTNDTILKQFSVSTGTLIPFSENFEPAVFPPAGWTINNPDNSTTWEITANALGNGTSAYSAYINLMNYATDGQTDEFYLPKINLTLVNNAQMSFKVAYRRYDAQYSDGLKVFVSSDCGASYNLVYYKSGQALATGSDMTQSFFPAIPQDWRIETVDLTAFSGNTVIVKVQSVNHNGNNLFLDDINIISDMPPTASFIADKTSSCSGEIQFTDLSWGIPASRMWDFGDGTSDTSQNPVHAYVQDGLYTVSLYVQNPYGGDTMIQLDYININLPETPAVISASRCGTGSVILEASGNGSVYWFDSEYSQVASGNGAFFTTPDISQTTQYFAENHDEESSQYVGSTDTTTFGGNGNFNAEYWLNFECISQIRLVSVLVNAGAPGIRTISLRDTLGNTLDSVTVNIEPGISRVTLNFNIQPGFYRLAGSKNANLWRNSQNITYPYTIPGLISITSSNVANRYYYFYKWEVKDPDCISARVPVTAYVFSSLNSGAATAQDTSVCTGETTLLALTGFAGDIHWQSSPDNINWYDISAGQPHQDSIFQTPPIVSGTFFRAKLSGYGCTDEFSNIIYISLSEGPVPGTAFAGDSVICSNDSVYLSVSGNHGTTQWQLSYDGVTGWTNIAGAASANYTTGPLSDNAWFRARVSFGSCPVVFTNIVHIIVNEPPQEGVISISDTDICVGSACEISLSAYSGIIQWQQSIDSLVWETISSITGPVFTPVLEISTFFRVVARSEGCPDAVSDIAKVNVHEPPVATIIINNASYGLNDGTATVFGTGGTWDYTFQWDSGTGNQTSQTAVDLAPGTYFVTMYDGICSYTASCIIQENPSNYPIAHFTVQHNMVCTGATVLFTDDSQNNPFSWFWNFPGGAPSSSNTQNPQVTYNSQGVYNVTLIVTNQYGSDTIFAPHTMMVTSPGALNFSVTPESFPGSADGSVIALVTGGNPPYGYYWNNGASTQTISGLSAGSYSVAVVDASGCFITEPVTVPVLTYSESDIDNQDIRIFPNPTRGPLFIYNISQGKVSIKITDIVGKTIQYETTSGVSYATDLKKFGQGIYFITLASETKTETFKITLSK